MLERVHLAIVQAVDKHGSLTAAAEILCVTQSALSHSMKKLEQQLGTDIWLREGRSLRLTQAGQYLLAVANRLLPQLDLAEERLRQYAQGERGALRIGMECHPCYQWLLKVGGAYLAAVAGGCAARPPRPPHRRGVPPLLRGVKEGVAPLRGRGPGLRGRPTRPGRAPPPSAAT